MTQTPGTPSPGSTAAPPSRTTPEQRRNYWRKNLSLTLTLLAVWFVVAYLLGIIFSGTLNTVKVGQAPLGFWVAQQGSIYVFILLIAVYAFRMNALDRETGVEG